MFYAGSTVWNQCKIFLSLVFLSLEIERAVISGNHLEIPIGQALPENVPVRLVTERRGHDILCALKSGFKVVLIRFKEILGAGLGKDRETGISGLLDLGEGLFTGQVHDIDRSTGHLGNGNSPSRGLSFGLRRPAQGVVFRFCFSLGQEVINKDAIVDHERSFVGEKTLETGDSHSHHFRDFIHDPVVEIGDGHVKTVINDGLFSGLLHPGVEGALEAHPFALDGEINQGRGPAERGRDGPGFKVVRRKAAHERHVQVGVNINPSR